MSLTASQLLSVSEALQRILATIQPLEAEAVALLLAQDRVLAQDVISDINLPPFANSSMDGYAVYAEDIATASSDAPASLTVSMDIPAGVFPNQPLRRGHAARIMTGAALPDGANAIVPVENTSPQWDKHTSAPPPVIHVYHPSKHGDYIRLMGEDIQRKETVLKAGQVIRPADIGILAALGRHTVWVVQRPKVAILSSGDELVEPHEPLTDGKIRNSNSYILAALVIQYGGAPIIIPTAKDTLQDTRRSFQDALRPQPNLILSSAGVSVGAFDHVRTVLEELGQIDFWRINLRPGKPLAYGTIQGIPFFGLPGNPVSAMVTFDVFVRPTLSIMAQRDQNTQTIYAKTTESFQSDGRRSYLRVMLDKRDDEWTATLTGTQSSGALSSMVKADGLLIVPEEVRDIQAGDTFEVRLLRPLSALS